MNKVIVFAIIIAAAVGLTVTVYSSNNGQTFENEPLPEFDWRNSGPFYINKEQYKLGENIAISIRDLMPNEVGSILFMSPEGIIANKIPFDGQQKGGFNTYWKPDTASITGLRQVKQLIGTWSMVFNGTNYAPLHFEVIDEYIKGAEVDIIDIPPKPVVPQEPIGPPLNDTN